MKHMCYFCKGCNDDNDEVTMALLYGDDDDDDDDDNGDANVDEVYYWTRLTLITC